ILLNLADFNFVRGEESFVRAILSEIPFLWHIYPQDDDIHLKKLNAFIENFNKYSKNKNDNNIYNLFTKFNEKLDFFDDFLKIKKSDNDIFREYKNYIVKNCNLVEKLLYYIDSRTNQTQEEI
ncbi:MAG: elongation factor P maturation arginine rhamnosyltransferase EarP, partial [Fusobacteriaceae bacterium]|nr:elongation factor P maturation arginine rhamnosyltransferase EarP [Fusobacteriaceae bacterium]